MRQRILDHFREIGYTITEKGLSLDKEFTKDKIREFSEFKRLDSLRIQKDLLTKKYRFLAKCLQNGEDCVPEKIKPRLDLVDSEWKTNLFRLASLTWSVQITEGMGRRFQYLVWDDHNEKLIGITALTDPIIAQKDRDRYIGWTKLKRMENLKRTMTAYILGAMQPYSQLLGGKLIASLLKSQTVLDDFEEKYNLPLLCIFLTSAMGRSSIYNRLKIGKEWIFRPIGYSGGFGVVHFSDKLSNEMIAFIKSENSPELVWNKRKMVWLADVIEYLDLPGEYMYHGIHRQLFACDMALNSREILATGEGVPDRSDIRPESEIAKMAIDRWVLGRAQRVTGWRDWNKERIFDSVCSPEELRQAGILGDTGDLFQDF